MFARPELDIARTHEESAPFDQNEYSELWLLDAVLIAQNVDEKAIQVIWVGDTITTDLAYDLKVPGRDQIDQSAGKIKQMLQDRGIIFKFREL